MTTVKKMKHSLTTAQKKLLKQIMPNFQDRWGKSAHVDLLECEHDRLISASLLEKFVKQLVKEINMIAHGPCHVARFGIGDLEGFSAMQFIQTSSIAVHLDEVGNRAFIDIFSCRDFDAVRARKFCKKYFKAQRSNMTVLDR